MAVLDGLEPCCFGGAEATRMEVSDDVRDGTGVGDYVGGGVGLVGSNGGSVRFWDGGKWDGPQFVGISGASEENMVITADGDIVFGEVDCAVIVAELAHAEERVVGKVGENVGVACWSGQSW